MQRISQDESQGISMGTFVYAISYTLGICSSVVGVCLEPRKIFGTQFEMSSVFGEGRSRHTNKKMTKDEKIGRQNQTCDQNM